MARPPPPCSANPSGEGDALITLRDVDGPVGVILLDGWKEMYLSVLDLLEPKFAAGSLIVADNAEMAGAAAYLERVRNIANGYVSAGLPAPNGAMELTCRVRP
ncbi:hypothetical protein ACWIGW_31900 [Nocardia brasiliensis]